MTTVLNAYQKDYPSITNRLKASVFTQLNPTAAVASEIDITSGHPARIWSFSGLPRDNYNFSLDEIDGAGLVVNNLAYFAVVPGQVDGLLSRDDEQIQVGFTTGFDTGASSFVFDGSGGKPNYIGWEIVASELNGRGIMVKDSLDYTWNKLTGTLTMVQPGDIFAVGTWWHIHFNPINNPIGGSVPTIKDFKINYITADTTIDDTYFGDALIIEPAGVYLEVTLPPLSTIVDGRALLVEIGGSSLACVKFIKDGSDPINFLDGQLFAITGERFNLYRATRPDTSAEWRVSNMSGNFNNLGQSVSNDQIQADVINAQLLDGSKKSSFQYARIYNQFVLQLPPTQVCNFDDWLTGNNKYLFSLANATDPGDVDKFYFPDRRNLFEKSNNSGKAGDYFADQVGEAQIVIGFPTGDTFNGHPYNPTALGKGLKANSPYTLNSDPITINSGKENLVKHYLNNKYILI